MKGTTFSVILPNGAVATRTTKTKAYTHVLLGRCAKTWSREQGCYLNSPEPNVYPLRWSESRSNASKATGEFARRGFIDFTIVEVSK